MEVEDIVYSVGEARAAEIVAEKKRREEALKAKAEAEAEAAEKQRREEALKAMAEAEMVVD